MQLELGDLDRLKDELKANDDKLCSALEDLNELKAENGDLKS